ncbi:insulinase family protein [Candidatus Babeliales bacterium]|nr:insulinase family protein [Candidatus Babeliales bacterium]MBP9843474.1 insulinase family protein [Candidatus Babeliales bacterium]
MKNNFLKISLATFFVVIGSYLLSNFDVDGGAESFIQDEKISVFTLDNGLKIIVCPKKDAATVSIQLWYNVGSKHEKDGERGIAHFIEHMIFKGTDTLTESDIDCVTTKLSGSCNAFTWYDYTGYLFNIPIENWDKVLPVMADCMQNCGFKQDHLNSELKAVIQEMKMRKDEYGRYLYIDMISHMFQAHPYHYSTIGCKQDLWSLTRDTLLAFYKKYYTPDNAVMVVVGDINPQDVHDKIEQAFGKIPAGNGWNQEQFHIKEDIKTKKISLHRPVQQATGLVTFLVPGFKDGNTFDLEVFSYVLARGKGSRFHKLLVDDLELVTQVNAFSGQLFEQDVFFIEFAPKQEQDIEKIVQYIQEQLDDIAQNGVTEKEIIRAQRSALLEHGQKLQNSQLQAYAIGKAFLAQQDPYYIFSYGNTSLEKLSENIRLLAAKHCTKFYRNEGRILPVDVQGQALLTELQQKSDEQDTHFLNLKIRETSVEGPRYANTVEVCDKKSFNFTDSKSIRLENGLEFVWFNNKSVDFVELQFDFKANHYCDPVGLEGLSNIVSLMMLEGSRNYPGKALSDEFDAYGMAYTIKPGFISIICLKQDFEKAVSLLKEVLTEASFEQSSFDKIKKVAKSQLQKFWDTPGEFGLQLAGNLVYAGHPYSKEMLGSQEGLDKISLEDCVHFYTQLITPNKAYFVAVGSIEEQSSCDIVQKIMGDWQGLQVQDSSYPKLEAIQQQEVLYSINRDQTTLIFAGSSVDAMHEDYDKLFIFDQILIGAALRMPIGSRLFDLRQRSGLFYTISGSLLYGANEQPGMIMIKTIVSNDRLAEAEKAILYELDHAIDTMTSEEFERAKKAIIHSFVLKFETNTSKASTFLFLKKYNLSADYFEQRIAALKNITVEDVKIAVKKILSSDKLAVIKIGRV